MLQEDVDGETWEATRFVCLLCVPCLHGVYIPSWQWLTSISSWEILFGVGRCCVAARSACLGGAAGRSGSLYLSWSDSRLCLSLSLSLTSLSCPSPDFNQATVIFF